MTLSPARSQFLTGLRMSVPVSLSIAAYGLVWGVLAGQAGLSPLEVLAMSTLVYAGASQFVALDLWVPNALPIASIVIATAIINLRLLMMTATLPPLFTGVPRWRAALSMYIVGDETWALAMAEHAKGNGNGTAAFLMGASILAGVAWVGSTLAGRVLGSVIADPVAYGLDFAFSAVFLALLLGMWRGKADLLPWLVGAGLAIVTARLVDGQWYVIVGGLGGSFAGALLEHRRQRDVA